ncbi:DUF6907 domain-containing protein [Streptomyces maoxianensis]|uniref:DUF6907 domain-containing protein n=1 Tax=Streptomyces maoxianensis TaxID=1459942 RepID=A0ABV9GA34_9ACTN
MSDTVPTYVKPSGGMVLPFAGLLPGIPSQPSAPAVEQPSTWSFVDRDTDKPKTVTCMPGCVLDHSTDIGAPRYPGDIWCQAPRQDVTLPVNSNGKPEEYRVLSSTLNVRPFDEKLSARLPFVSLEIIDDHWIEDLDPDGLETVIRTLGERLEDLRQAHADLVRTRAEYIARAGR